MKLLNDPQIESSLRAIERATARIHDVCQTTRAGCPANPRTAARSTPTPCMGVPRPSKPSKPGVPERVRVGVGVVVGGLLMSMAGCPSIHRDPTLEPPPSGCVTGATVCRNGAPWRCNDGEWSQADRACGLLNDAGTIGCCLTVSPFPARPPIHACVPSDRCIAETP